MGTTHSTTADSSSSMEDIMEAREHMRSVCDMTFPVEWRGCPLTETCDVSPSPASFDLHALASCTDRVMQDTSPTATATLGAGAFGTVFVLKADPRVAVKIIRMRAVHGLALSNPPKSSNFLDILPHLPENVQTSTRKSVTLDAVESSEPAITAYLSRMMERGEIPPCVPAFIATYWGVVKQPEAPVNTWNYRVNDKTHPFTSVPAIYLLMENLGPSRVGDLSTLVVRASSAVIPMVLCTLACVTSLHTLCQFVHADLHTGNILICRSQDDVVGLRIVQNGHHIASYQIVTGGLFPKMIDFGFSMMVHHGEEVMPPTVDTKGIDVRAILRNTSDTVYLFNSLRRVDVKHKFVDQIVQPVMGNKAVQRKVYNARGVRVSADSVDVTILEKSRVSQSTILHILLDAYAKHGPIPDSVTTYDIHVDETWVDV